MGATIYKDIEMSYSMERALDPQYTSNVTSQYKQATKHRVVRYTVEENFVNCPEIVEEYDVWRSQQESVEQLTFKGVFHNSFVQPMFDIRTAEIREDWGQRNALLERTRKAKILGMARNFDVKLFEPISVDYIASTGDYIIRDGGGRAHAAWLRGIFHVPATVRYIDNAEESRSLFNAQDKYAAAISSYDKFLQQLLDTKHNRHNMASDTWNIAKSSGFSLHYSNKSLHAPLVEGIGVLQRIIRKSGGDAKDVNWGSKRAPNIAMAVDAIKHAFPELDEIPVSVLEALTAFVYVSKNRIPSGDEGIARLKQFVCDVRDSHTRLKDLGKWAKTLHFDSANHYSEYGAASFMEKWNVLYVNKNKGRKKPSVYRWVKWDQDEIEITKNKLMPFARDESLLPS
jgi:hypothetical protein